MLLAMLCNFIFLTYSLILWGGGEVQEKQWLLCAQWWVAPELRAGRGSVGERGLGAPGCSPGHRKVWRFLSIRVVEHFFFFLMCQNSIFPQPCSQKCLNHSC